MLTCLHNRSFIIDGHFTMVQNVVIAITARSVSVHASFFTAEIPTAIQNNSTVVNNISLTIGNVINSTRRTVLVRRFAITSNSQSCTQLNSNGIATIIFQRIASQIQCNLFTRFNDNIFGIVFIKSNCATIGCLVNLLLQRLGRCRFTGTSIANRVFSIIRRKRHRCHGQHHHHSEKSR